MIVAVRRSMLSVADSVQSYHLGNVTSSEGSADTATPDDGHYADPQASGWICLPASTQSDIGAITVETDQ